MNVQEAEAAWPCYPHLRMTRRAARGAVVSDGKRADDGLMPHPHVHAHLGLRILISRSAMLPPIILFEVWQCYTAASRRVKDRITRKYAIVKITFAAYCTEDFGIMPIMIRINRYTSGSYVRSVRHC